MTSTPAFTIMLPVNRPPDLMGFAIQSVLAQTRGDFELFIICDGAPSETVTAAEIAAAMDARLRVFRFVKGEHHGEAHRHAVLERARGRMICQIADDDIWFPEHLAEMAVLLEEVEFGNTLHTTVFPGDHCRIEFLDLSDPTVQVRMRAQLWNFFSPTVAGYRLSAYRRLALGWSPAPPGLWTDLAMWRRFLDLPNIVTGSRFAVTSLHFPASLRKGWSLAQRRAEIARYAGLAQSERWRDGMQQHLFRRAARQAAGQDGAAVYVAHLERVAAEAQQNCCAYAIRVAELEQMVIKRTWAVKPQGHSPPNATGRLRFPRWPRQAGRLAAILRRFPQRVRQHFRRTAAPPPQSMVPRS